jgi:hypothetical protein
MTRLQKKQNIRIGEWAGNVFVFLQEIAVRFFNHGFDRLQRNHKLPP